MNNKEKVGQMKPSGDSDLQFRERMLETLSCRDCDYIPKVESAGAIVNDPEMCQVMHNGIKVHLGGYNGAWMAELIRQMKGHHEPQEEKAFYEVLKSIPSNATMIELGSHWSYYSMWFNKTVKNAVNYMIEPNPVKFQLGIANFNLNNMKGNFTNAFIGREYLPENVFTDWDGKEYKIPQVCIDQFIEDCKIDYIDILHSDIQGAEYDMLLGAEKAFRGGKIGYTFISTHGDCHDKCMGLLLRYGFDIIASHTIKESYSADGLIVAAARHIDHVNEIVFSKKDQSQLPIVLPKKKTKSTNPHFIKDGNTWSADKALIDSYIAEPANPFLVSFPRTGSHWLRMLMELYFEKPGLTRIFNYGDAADFTCYHTHDMELDVIRQNVIYLWRDPVDTIFSQLSYYNENIKDASRILHWATLYARHLSKWLLNETVTEKKVVLTYEAMKADLKDEFKKVCGFWGLPLDAQRLERVAQQVSKEQLKAKNISDKQVVKISDDYEQQRAWFRASCSDTIRKVMLQINPALAPFISSGSKEPAGSQKRYYSQHGEDVILDKIFAGKEKGFFVEIGCIDGKRFSNTLHFAEQGWNGVCVEAHPDYIPMLRRNRPESVVVHAAITERDQASIKFYANSRGSLSTVDKEQESYFREKYGKYFTGFDEVDVPAMTLGTVLKKHCKGRPVDFISLDIEGHEVEALAGHDFAACKPRLWVIECDSQEHKSKIESCLQPQGYCFLGIFSGNAFYSLQPSDADKIPDQIPATLTHTEHPCDRGGDQHLSTIVKFAKNTAAPVPRIQVTPAERKPKIVGLVAARNEVNIIGQSLRLLSKFTDAIVFLDDCSDDDTLQIVKNLAAECNVEQILTKNKWLRDEPGDRNRMLQAGREIGGTHFMVLDADEAFTSNLLMDEGLKKTVLSMAPGDQLWLNWIALWRSTEQYRHDQSVWTNNYKPFIFCDDGQCAYSSEFIHTPRVPQNLKGRTLKLEGYEHGVLHFQFVNWQNLLLKQAWYRCLERIREPQKAISDINNRYAPSKDETGIRLEPSRPEWFSYYSDFSSDVFNLSDNWRLQQIKQWFDKHGIDFFKDLDIWDIIRPVKESSRQQTSNPILVSAIVSTYNSEEFIRGCLQDLVEQTLYQKGLLEIVVVNSNSEQNEDAVIREFASRYPNINYIKTDSRETIYAAWNRGIQASRGKYITNANTDDRHAPEMLETLARMLEADPAAAVVYSHFYITHTPNQTWQAKTPVRCADWHPPFSREALLKACFTGPQPMWRRSLHEEYGWFDASLKVAGDYEFFLRISQTHTFILNKQPLGLYYENPNSLQRTAGTWESEDVRIKQLYKNNWDTIIRRPFDPNDKKRFWRPAKSLKPEVSVTAINSFQRAQQQIETGNMLSAQHHMRQYKESMQYDKLNPVLVSSRKPNPLFSVVLITHNRPDDVRVCIDSLRRQEFSNYEIIVVDNGDADKKASHLAGNVDVYVNSPINFNPSEGRNIAAHFAKGQILVFLDDDAQVGPEYLPSIRIAFEQYDILALRGKISPKNEVTDSISALYDQGDNPHSSFALIEGNTAFRRDAYLAVGGMDPLLFGHEGSDLSYRLIQQFRRPSAVMYWPQAIIYHDYGDADKFAAKKNRYARNRDYIKYKYDVDVMGLKHEIARQPLRKNTSGQLLPPLPAIHRPAQPQSPAESSRGPKVSVVMSCHNAAPFLAETMDSILTQTLTDWELLITDDGSTDETQSLLMDYANMDSRIRIWFFDDQKGPYVRRNFAIEQAKAPFISIQDADDLMAFNKLQVLYEEIRRDEKLAIVGSHFRRFLDVFRGAEFGDRMQKKITHAELMEAFPQTWHLCWHGSAIIRKSLFDTIGLYDEQPYGSDTFWLSKAGLYGWLTGRVKFKNVPEYLTYKREHAASQTGQISPVDPRSRRHRLERYYLQKLHQIMTEARKDPSLDPAQKIRECTCSDFIPKFGREFKKWESAPLNKTMVQSVMNRGLAQFSSEAYVSALITLNYLDQMIPGASGSFKNLNFTRGLAWYACGDDARAAAHLRQEIQLTGNQFAQAFLQTHLAAAGKKGDAAQRRANIRKFVETASQQELAPSVAGAEQRDPARMSDDLHGKLAIAKQFLSQGHTQRAAGVYRDLLSDNMLTGHIALKEKLQKLVGLIESAAPSTSAAAESDWKKS